MTTKNSLKRFFPPAESSNRKKGKKSIAQETIEELSSGSDTEQNLLLKELMSVRNQTKAGLKSIHG